MKSKINIENKWYRSSSNNESQGLTATNLVSTSAAVKLFVAAGHKLWSHYSSSLLTKQTLFGFIREVWTQRRIPTDQIQAKTTDKTKADQSTSKLQQSYFGATCSRAACSWASSLALSWRRCRSSLSVSPLSSPASWLKWASGGPGSRPPSELAKICSLWTLNNRMDQTQEVEWLRDVLNLNTAPLSVELVSFF